MTGAPTLDLLDGLGAIARFLGPTWSRRRVKRLVSEGVLPVSVVGAGRGRRYFADRDRLSGALRGRPPAGPGGQQVSTTAINGHQ